MKNEASRIILLIANEIVQQCSTMSYKVILRADFLIGWLVSEHTSAEIGARSNLCCEFQNMVMKYTVNRLNNNYVV